METVLNVFKVMGGVYILLEFMGLVYILLPLSSAIYGTINFCVQVAVSVLYVRRARNLEATGRRMNDIIYGGRHS